MGQRSPICAVKSYPRGAVIEPGVHPDKLDSLILGAQAEIACRLACDLRIERIDQMVKGSSAGVVIVVARNRVYAGNAWQPVGRGIKGATEIVLKLRRRSRVVDVSEVDENVRLLSNKQLLEQQLGIGQPGAPVSDDGDP